MAAVRMPLEAPLAQLTQHLAFDDRLTERVILFLQTRDPGVFPFTRAFDDAKMAAFITDLREGLAEIMDTGSARKTSATGFVASDQRLHDIVREWAAANGGWPEGSNPRDPDTALGAVIHR